LSLIICSLHEGNVWYRAAWVFAYFISQIMELIVMNICISFYLCLYFGKNWPKYTSLSQENQIHSISK